MAELSFEACNVYSIMAFVKTLNLMRARERKEKQQQERRGTFSVF
jgi:hypothetical protein